MQLIRLLPEQVSEHWVVIRRAVRRSLPPTTYGSDRRDSNILNNLLIGRMVCWVGRDKVGVKLIILTNVVGDSITGVKNLQIYSMFNPSKRILEEDDWIDGMETMKRYARDRDCYRVVAYSKVPRVIEMSRDKLGADVSNIFMTFEVEGEA